MLDAARVTTSAGMNPASLQFSIVISSASLVATFLEITFNGFLDIPHNNVLCFFQVQGGYLYLIFSTGSFASNNVFQSCHYPNDPINVIESFIVNESKVCGDCGRTTDIFFSPGSGSSLCSPNLSPLFSLWVDTELGGDSTNNIPIHRGRTRVLTNLICCYDPISRHHSLLLEFHQLNLISFSMTFLSRLDNAAAFNSLWGVDNLLTGSILCRNKSTAVVTFVKLLSDVGCKTFGEITSIAKDEQPWLPK